MDKYRSESVKCVPSEIIEERKPDVIAAVSYLEKMVAVSYEALTTLTERLSPAMSSLENDSKGLRATREVCPMATEIYQIGDTAERVFDGLMDIIKRLEF